MDQTTLNDFEGKLKCSKCGFTKKTDYPPTLKEFSEFKKRHKCK